MKFLADNADAHWLIDNILSNAMHTPEVKAEEFQVWKLVVRPDNTANLYCEDGNDNQVTSQAIEFTDFPLPEITLWLEYDTLMLPSER